MNKNNIYLPNLGCEYIGTEYDKDNDVWIVKYKQKPGMWGMALKDTGVPLPTDDPSKIKKVKVKDKKVKKLDDIAE